jgi:hypothetical protein
MRRRWQARLEDSGQALVIVLIAVLLIAALIPIVAESVTTETVQVSRDTLNDLALAAAQAGANDYRTFIDNNSSYYAFTCGTPKGNLALGAGSSGSYACNTWEPVSGTTNEWFHYVPDASQLAKTGGGSPGQLLLEVTGRAGTLGDYQYRSIVVGFQLSGILTDSYYSEYELTDPQEPGVYTDTVSLKLGGVTTQYPLNGINVSYAETEGGTTTYYGPETLLDALCLYHTFNENTFIDSLGNVTNQWVNGGHAVASPTNPYYGPYYDQNVGMTINIPATLPNGTVPPNAGGTITIPSPGGNASICGAFGQGIYPSSVVFNGIAYTNDQLARCGNPTFNAALESGAPSNIPYGDDWPGSQAEVIGGTTEYFPKGYTYDFTGGCSSSSQPTWGSTAFPKTPVLNQDQHLPPTTAGFLPYANGTLSPAGCLFTGPTMIEFIKGGTMNVWSPLSQNTSPDGSNPNACGTYTPGQPWQTGITVPTGAVMYVEGEQSSGPNSSYDTPATAPTITTTPCSSFTGAMATADAVDVNTCVPSGGGYVSAGVSLQTATGASGGVPAVPGSNCLDPYFYNTVVGNKVVPAPTSLGTCEQGDAIVEGEFTGQVTIASDNNIIVSRDLTYQCADGGGAATDVNPASVAACNAAGTNDVLALVPTQQLIVAGPTNQPFNTSATSSPTNCTNSGGNACGSAAAPTCTDDGTGTTQTLANVVPWLCDINNTYADHTTGIVIDAAVVDLTGSTYAQNFQTIGLGNANMYQNGTNINYFPGFNGSTDRPATTR